MTRCCCDCLLFSCIVVVVASCLVVVVVLLFFFSRTMQDSTKFPRTTHILNLGSATRDDLVLDAKDVRRLLVNNVIIEEKIDGANLGISITEKYPYLCFVGVIH